MLGNLPGTQLVGFATTIKELSADAIQSVQPIYFSSDKQICGCLSNNPTMSTETQQIEKPPENESYLDRLQREGKLGTFLTSMISLVIFVLAIAIVSCVLCYFARA